MASFEIKMDGLVRIEEVSGSNPLSSMGFIVYITLAFGIAQCSRGVEGCFASW